MVFEMKLKVQTGNQGVLDRDSFWGVSWEKRQPFACDMCEINFSLLSECL